MVRWVSVRALLAFVAILTLCAVADAGPRIVVLTYNIHHGEGMDRRFDLERIAGIIKDARPDMAAIQEVDRKTRRSSGMDQAAELSRLTGLHMAFGKTIEYQGGEYGVMILARTEPQDVRVHRLPMPAEGERRIALAARIRLDGAAPEFTLICTHLDATRDTANRVAQATSINEFVTSDKGNSPMILAGDLNATPKSRPIEVLLRQWRDTSGDATEPTSPADTPKARIDYVMVRPAGAWRIVESRVIDEKIASDHRPVVVTLELIAAR